jgi:hypothetical protein
VESVILITEIGSADSNDAEFFRHPVIDEKIVNGRRKFSVVQVSAASENKQDSCGRSFVIFHTNF